MWSAGRFTALYDKQPAEGSAGLTNDQLVQIGVGVGLTDSTFAQCVTSQKYANWVAHNTDAAASKNIQSTPTVLVNGKQIQNTVNALQQAVG